MKSTIIKINFSTEQTKTLYDSWRSALGVSLCLIVKGNVWGAVFHSPDATIDQVDVKVHTVSKLHFRVCMSTNEPNGNFILEQVLSFFPRNYDRDKPILNNSKVNSIFEKTANVQLIFTIPQSTPRTSEVRRLITSILFDGNSRKRKFDCNRRKKCRLQNQTNVISLVSYHFSSGEVSWTANCLPFSILVINKR